MCIPSQECIIDLNDLVLHALDDNEVTAMEDKVTLYI